MKNNKNFFQQKGFYFALYLCVVVMAVIASIGTYVNLRSFNNSRPKEIVKVEEKDISQPVLNNQSKSYLAPNDRNGGKFSPIPSLKNKLTGGKKKAASEIFSIPPSPSIISSPTPISENSSPINSPNTNENGEQSFNSFDENQKMLWPVFGEIIMDYDDENLVYDKTLEQYRTNECVSLSAKVGEQVRASADGIVKLITKTAEGGNTIVIDHGNDWTTTYSQLQDDLLVNEGDTVKKGQVIGGVNSPTKYGILLGSHLDFKIVHEDSTVNPKLFLAEK